MTKVILVVVGLAVLAAIGDQVPDRKAAPRQATATAAPEACGTIGKWDVCVVDLKRQRGVSSGSSGYTAGKGSVYLLVEIEVSHSGRSEDSTWDLDFTIGDGDGNHYSPDIDAMGTAMMSRLDTCGMLGDQVNPRQSQRCWLVYYLSKGTPGIHLVVRDRGKRLRLALGE